MVTSGKTDIQEIVGTLLYHSRSLKNPLLPALGTIENDQSIGTEEIALAATQLLDYHDTYPNLVLCFRVSKIVLRIHNDISYHSVCGARSQVAGFICLSYLSPAPDVNHTGIATNLSPINGAIHILCTILKCSRIRY